MGLRLRLRVAVAVLLLGSCASAPIRERCGLLTICAPPPKMAPELATIDRFLFQRAAGMATTVRALPNFMGDFYRREFLEQLLPRLCDRMEEARALAGAGRSREAGASYEGLAVAAEVMALEVAFMQVADYADHKGAAGGLIVGSLQAYDRDMAPLMEAALSADRERLKRALPEGERQYTKWLGQLKTWEVSLKLGLERVEIAHKLWDLSLAVVATWEAAGVAAELAAGRGPPMALGALAGSDGAAAVAMDRAVLVEAAEALRKLLASGALDPAVVAGLAHMASGYDGSLAGAGLPAGPLTPEQARNLQRFEQKLPAGAGPTAIHELPGGGKAFTAEVPGKVPGSKAIYEKQVDASGKTVQYTKTTIDPSGKLVHVKDKLTDAVVEP